MYSLRQFLGILLVVVAVPLISPDLRAEAPGADGYKIEANIAYRNNAAPGDGVANVCKLDVYYPENIKGYPTLVWFHGGGLTEGNRWIPEQLKKHGIAVVAVDYRLSPNVKAPVYIEDAAAAVAWTFKNIERFGGAADRIYISGHSAGGYLTLMLGLDKHYLAACGIDANDIAGLIPLSGQAITHFTVRHERGQSEKQPIVDDLAPLYHVRADAPPMLLVTGDRERELLGRYEENAYLWRMMHIAGHNATDLRELKGLNHGEMLDASYALIPEFINKINALKSASVNH